MTEWLSGFWGPFFVAAALSAVVLNWLTVGRKHGAYEISLMLLTFCIASNLLPSWSDPLTDTAGFYLCFFLCFGVPQMRWCWIVMTCFAASLITHGVFLLDEGSYWRQFTLNVFFAVAVVATAFPGGACGLRRLRGGRHRGLGARALAHCQVADGKVETAAPAGTLKVARRGRLWR